MNKRRAVIDTNVLYAGLYSASGASFRVLRLIEQGAITCVSALEGHSIRCGRCGAPAISASKKLCQACLEKLNAQVAVAQRTIRLGEKKQVEVGQFHENVRQALDSKRLKD